MRPIEVAPGTVVQIPSAPGAPEQAHKFGEDEITALATALAARRALLVRGEPGVGKTQLAKAAAVLLKRPFTGYAVDSRCESRDLLWHFDAVRRLADAQMYAALLGNRSAHAAKPMLSGEIGDDAILKQLSVALDIEKYIQPRPLWWGLDWHGAAAQAAKSSSPAPSQRHEHNPKNGVVVLIDEIDKGDADVPNGLLEALGAGEFTIPGRAEPIRPAQAAERPLVIITTNEERMLPDAFVRRCIVLTLRLPLDPDELIGHLAERGRAHFPRISEAVLRQAATLLSVDRKTAQDQRLRPLPGQAEFMDLVRAVIDLAGNDPAQQQACLDKIALFALRKHPPGATM